MGRRRRKAKPPWESAMVSGGENVADAGGNERDGVRARINETRKRLSESSEASGRRK